MKIHLINKTLGFVLILGLISCGSDSKDVIIIPSEPQQLTPEEAETKEPLNIQYGHKDKSVHKIQDAKKISVNSRIELSGKDGTIPKETTVDIQCRRPPLPDTFKKTMVVKDPQNLNVSDILPIEAFGVNIRGGNALSCQVLMDVVGEDGNLARVELKRLEIQDFKNYSNYQPFEKIEIKSGQDFVWQELWDVSLKPLTPTQVAVLSCESRSSLLDYQNPSKLFKDFFSEDSEIKLPRQKCRIAITDEGTESSNLVGPEFFINKLLKPIQLVTENYFQFENANAILIDQPFVSYVFKNPNPEDVYIQIHESKISVTLGTIYRVGREKMRRAGQPRGLSPKWEYSGDLNTDSQNGDLRYFKISGHGEFKMEAVGSFAYDCSKYARNSTTIDDVRIYGVRTLLENFPKISQNRFNGMDNFEGQLLKDDNQLPWAKEKKFQDFTHWSPLVKEGFRPTGGYMSPKYACK